MMQRYSIESWIGVMAHTVFALLVIFCSLSCQVRAHNSEVRAEQKNAAPNANDQSRAGALRRKIQDGTITSIEDLQNHLTRMYSVLVYHSRSTVQEVSRQFPRVISFQRSGDVFFAIGGNPQGKGGRLVESLEFDEQHKRFDLYLYDFSKSKVTIQKNPSECVACHSSDPTPIWDSYPTWPGVVGSEHQPLDYEFAEARSKSVAREFRESDGDRSRYQHVGDLQWYFENGAGTNTLFGKVVARRLVERLHRIFDEHLRQGQFEQARKALALIPFKSASSIFDPAMFQNFAVAFDASNPTRVLAGVKKNFNRLVASNEAAQAARLAYFRKVDGKSAPQEIRFYGEGPATLACLQFIATETKLFIPRWSSALDADEIQFVDGFRGLGNFRELLEGKDLSGYPPPERFDILPF